MKRKFFSFIRPGLNLLDSGRFFRAPFGWLYAVIAIVFMLSPLMMAGLTILWNNANKYLEECQKMYTTIALPEFKDASLEYDTLKMVTDQYAKEMNNASDCLVKATKQADYYGEYASYGPEYKAYYNNALDVKRQWDIVHKDAVRRWSDANDDLELVKPRYEKARKVYELAEENLKDARKDVEKLSPFGVLFKNDRMKNGNAIVALVLFTVMLVLAGVFNFLLWWSRMLTLKHLSSVQDRFVATPLAAHFIQTLGESLGFSLAIWGFFTAIIRLTCNITLGQFGFNFTDLGVLSIFLPVIIGFLITFFFRIGAELLRALTTIADNTGR